ncbi:AraC-type DNA-binding protein [Clostridium sp. USBA 49]|uniref:helix-turn-helix transcriptional regulator n=1 Tax=Clostridium TaxID=1485 RepID=UPI0009D24616|nr:MULTISPECIES: helix-turn-helix transcriptional regulator [Clostridium]SKA84257.1 AraC-type DNA-binding protein [Clostridium sp. USBA 49]
MCCNCGIIMQYDKRYLIKKIIQYMNENYMNAISLEMISNYIHLNPIYLSKLFKEETGESPINYLIGIRLYKAKELLDNGEFTVKEIASMVGYDDPYYFSKLFKKYYGCSPKKYKNK